MANKLPKPGRAQPPGQRGAGCGTIAIVLTVALVALVIYASRQIEDDWARVRPLHVSETKWAEKRKQCEEAKLAAAECASTTDRKVENVIAKARNAEQAELCARDDPFEAQREAEEAARAQLKSPSSASFIGRPSISHDRCKWTISGQVDSENSFGATLRARYRVELLRASKDVWVPTFVRVVE